MSGAYLIDEVSSIECLLCLWLQETEKRLKDIVTGKRAAAAANANGVAKKSQLSRPSSRLMVTVSLRALRLSL